MTRRDDATVSDYQEKFPGIDPQRAALAFLASCAALGQIPKSAVAFGVEFLGDRRVQIVVQLTGLTETDREDLEHIAADFWTALEPEFDTSIDEIFVTSRTYDFPSRDIEWLWAAHDSESA